jgi:actin related protein 2/3 complex, subunit 3
MRLLPLCPDPNLNLNLTLRRPPPPRADTFKAYFKQAREELGLRLVERVFADGAKSKWWQFFSKRKFMGKELQ